ncbi:MAG: type IX secretion system membrane protein PorP/SprF [Bacteroides sp.]|nr:type IX secretion system membrane protein PorP/SprF [Bacteroides sp.]
MLHCRPISILLAVILCCSTAFVARAQVDAQFTQYFEVPSYYNAAATGTSDYLNIRAGSRMQWTGIPNAPVTFLALGEMPLKLGSKRIGVGLVLQQESMGLYKNMTFGAQGSYKLKLWKGELSIGFQLGLFDESFKGSEVILPDGDDFHESTDDGIPTTDVHGTSFDLEIGAFYTHRYFRAGISVTHVNEPAVTMSTDGSGTENEYEFKAGRIAYFIADGNIPVKNTLFEIQPSMLVKTDFTFTTAEFTVRARYKKFLTAGLGYRYNDAVSLILGAQYKDFFIGYSYDYPVSAISRVSNGSHEVWAGYRLKLDLGEKNRHKHKSIRIM